MKTQFAATVGVCLATVFGAALMVRPASAAVTDILNVKLTMATNVGNTTLPAGEYTVRDLQTGSTSGVLEFSSANGHSVNAIVRQIPVSGHDETVHSEVVLRRAGEGYQIDQIWVQGLDHGFQLVTSELR